MSTSKILLLLGAVFAGNLSASSVLTCSFNGGAFTSSGCYSAGTFGFTDWLDWQAAYGTADTVANPNQVFDTTNGPWIASTPGGNSVSASYGFGYTGNKTLSRVDNFQMVYENGAWTFADFSNGYSSYSAYSGMFNSATSPSDPVPGDHLLSTNHNSGPLEIDFATAVSGAFFRISTPTSGDLYATVAAYAVAHPTALDTPIMTYSIVATNASGSCASLVGAPPVPCNVAPFLGVQSLLGIQSIIITSPDSAGLLIDTLYLDPSGVAPEPGTFGLIGLGVAALIIKQRRACRN